MVVVIVVGCEVGITTSSFSASRIFTGYVQDMSRQDARIRTAEPEDSECQTLMAVDDAVILVRPNRPSKADCPHVFIATLRATSLI